MIVYDEIAQSLRTPDNCDVHSLAGLVIDEAKQGARGLEEQTDRLQRHIREIFLAGGSFSHHNDRYRALCLRLLLEEHILRLHSDGAYSRLRPHERQHRVQRDLYAAGRTLRQLISTMIGKGFKSTGGMNINGSEGLWARSSRYVKICLDIAPGSLLASAAVIDSAYLAFMCGEKALGPKLHAFETAATNYEWAATLLLEASHAQNGPFCRDLLSLERFEQAWQRKNFSEGKRKIFLKKLGRIMSGLSRSYAASGRLEDAKRAALTHLEVARQIDDSDMLLMAEFELAAADEHLDQPAAIERLERVLTDSLVEAYMAPSDNSMRRQILTAMGQLALLLSEQGATAATQRWVAATEAWKAPTPHSHQRIAMKRVDAANRWNSASPANTGWAGAPSRRGVVRPPSRAGMAMPTDNSASKALFYISRDLTASIQRENVPSLVENLARLAGLLLDRKLANIQPKAAEDLAQSLRQIEEWKPTQRIPYLSGPLPPRWLSDSKQEALRVAELCWEFAARYCPADGLRVLETAGRAAVRVYGLNDERTRQHWREAATQAQQLGNWQLAVEAHLKVAWTYSGSPVPQRQAKRAAQSAYRAMLDGFRRLAHLYEVTTLLEQKWTVYPARVARAFAQADPQSWEAFSALDVGQGLALSATRSADSAMSRNLLALQHEEQQILSELAHSGFEGAGRLSEVRNLILDLTQYGGSTLLAGSGPGELTDLLWGLGADAAVIQLGHTKDDIVISAARLDGSSLRPIYHSLELGKYSLLADLMTRMWEAINIDPFSDPLLSLSGSAALSQVYATLVEPLREFLSGTVSWHVVGHGIFAGLPWHAIRTPGGRFLIEDVAIGYAPSVKALFENSEQQAKLADTTLIIGWPDEQGVGSEAEDIARIVEAAGAPVMAPQERAEGLDLLLDGGRRWRVIHIVGHGENRPFPHALESFMQFGPARVTAREVLDSGVHAGLVFINACHLAKSDEFAGDLYGFPFAFLASGTPVIAAAAPVYRPYAGWFARRLHRALLADTTPLDAYVQTVRSFISDPWNSHPVFWAPYFYIGGTQA